MHFSESKNDQKLTALGFALDSIKRPYS